MPHKLKFPLPLPEQVSFTKYKIEKSGSVPGTTSNTGCWDDGKCKICNKNGIPVCNIQGIPGMCKTCYHFFAIYSQKDDAGLERISCYRPVTIYQIQEAVEKTKAPYIEASKAAEKTAKKMLFNAFIETLDAIAGTASSAVLGKEQKITKTASQQQESIKQHKETARTQKKKKRHLHWYQWILLILLLHIIIEFIIPLVLFLMWNCLL
ncbi:MAG: hypothetical protein OSJ45_02555 [Lachnospiraceae bacterium]|nr:hypothetical protein [Lachnospiraceae bacterium]